MGILYQDNKRKPIGSTVGKAEKPAPPVIPSMEDFHAEREASIDPSLRRNTPDILEGTMYDMDLPTVAGAYPYELTYSGEVIYIDSEWPNLPQQDVPKLDNLSLYENIGKGVDLVDNGTGLFFDIDPEHAGVTYLYNANNLHSYPKVDEWIKGTENKENTTVDDSIHYIDELQNERLYYHTDKWSGDVVLQDFIEAVKGNYRYLTTLDSNVSLAGMKLENLQNYRKNLHKSKKTDTQ